MLCCIEADAFPRTSAERRINLQAQICKNSKAKNKNVPSEASPFRPAAPHHHLPAGARPDASLFLFLQAFHLDNARSLDGCQNTFGKLVTCLLTPDVRRTPKSTYKSSLMAANKKNNKHTNNEQEKNCTVISSTAVGVWKLAKRICANQ